LGLCVSIFIASALGAIVGGPLTALLLPLPVLVVARWSRERWLARFSHDASIQVVTIIALHLSSFCYFLKFTRGGEAVPSALNALVQKSHTVAFLSEFGTNIALSGFFLVLFITVNLLLLRKDVSSARANPGRNEIHIVPSDFRLSLDRYCKALVGALDRYDSEVNWSDRELTPLEAEVETERTERFRPSIARDLVAAIRDNRRSDVFVVLGDPGSGKSVSLRRLVRVLCEQAAKTGVVPVYVNLREYPAGEEPTTESLLDFVREVTWRQIGRDGRTFLDTWYEPFRKSGRLFFVVDSFDELPAILDCDEKSDTHHRIASAFDRFFTQEVLTCRAVLASRHFRAPVNVRGTRLLIRPFTEMQVRRAMQTWLLGKGIDIRRYLRRLFQERPHLVPLLRNPFTAELIAEYAIAGKGSLLPASLYEVFDHYLSERLEKDQSRFKKSNLSALEIRLAAGVIANSMYNSQAFGLEADVDEVAALLAPRYGVKAGAIVEALQYARLARVGGTDRRRFSFVHRRFAEFFVVDCFRCEGGSINLGSIPTDSRWRDCLVMCCGILDLPNRVKVATYCWLEISSAKAQFEAGKLGQARGAVHCIRFLADAFRSDPEALNSFQRALSELTLDLLRSTDTLVAKIAAELIPILDNSYQQSAIVRALEKRSRWISDTTLSSCRHLSQVSDRTGEAISNYFRAFSVRELMGRYPDLNFSLSLSDAFRIQRADLRLAVAEIVVRAALASVLLTWTLIKAPSLVFIPLLLAAVGWAFHSLMKRVDSVRHSSIPPYQGVLGARDSIDAWSRLLILTLPWSYFAFAEIIHSADGVFSSIYNLKRERDVVGGLSLIAVMATSVTLCFRWDWISKLLLRKKSGVREPRDPNLGCVVEEPKTSPRKSQPPNSLFRQIAGEKPADTLKVLGYIVGIFGLGAGIILFWLALPRTVKETIIALFVCAILGLLLFFLCKIALLRIHGWILSTKERKRMLKTGLPEVTSCVELYEYLRTFRSSAIQVEYLQTLRFRRVKLKGDITKSPKELLADHQVAEELARLRELWLGFVN
jgi:hypothetical protein